jgi:hypothetical protein
VTSSYAARERRRFELRGNAADFAFTSPKRKAVIMGEAGNKPRKFRRRLPKVPKGAEPNDIHLAGLANSSGGAYGNRLDHELSGARSQNLSKFGRFILWCLGRRPPTKAETSDR